MKKLFICLLCILLVGCDKLPIKRSKDTSETSEVSVVDDPSVRYKAYLSQINSYEDTMGLAEPVEVYSGFYQIKGLSFMKLVDFQNDGEEELLLAYLQDEETSTYLFEIFGYVNHGVKLLGSGSLFSTDGNVQTVRLCTHKDKTYLITGSEDSFFDYSFLTISNNKMTIKKTIKGEMDEEKAKIDGEDVSYDEAEEALREWTANEQDYVLNYECDLIISQNDSTRYLLKAGASSSSTEPSGGDNTYILPQSNQRKLKKREVKNLTSTQLMYARNEIYARHGRKFKTVSIQNYFNNKSWYTPLIEADEFSDKQLTTVERYNVNLIKKYERAKKSA
ncbi:MAG: YARHG domain-containing protein [Erysipelotrichaceae bacterium]|nr:YARHG domain-containing protein [Erysipelotrichaceae bacterium]